MECVVVVIDTLRGGGVDSSIGVKIGNVLRLAGRVRARLDLVRDPRGDRELLYFRIGRGTVRVFSISLLFSMSLYNGYKEGVDCLIVCNDITIDY